MDLITTLLFGLVVGVLAKLVMPGRDPGGFIVTMLLGVAGSFLGSFLGRMIWGPAYGAGWLMSIAGAVLLLFLYRLVLGRRGPLHA